MRPPATRCFVGLHATPSFWLAQAAVLALGLWAGWFPISGMTSARTPPAGLGLVVDGAHHLILPVLVLAATEVAVIARLTRVRLLEELSRDYVRTARAKGLSGRRVLWRHALPCALAPVVTVIGGRVGHLLAGSVLVEAVFGWPGIGRLLLTSVQSRDLPIVLGILLVIAATVIVANIVTDLIYVRLDPASALAERVGPSPRATQVASGDLGVRRRRSWAWARTPSAVVGIALTAVVLAVAALADVLAPGDPFAPVGPALSAPSSIHLIGTCSAA